VARKAKLEDEYKAALTEIEEELQKNRAKYKFLHDLITETGDSLVKAIEDFFIWVGFENTVNMDETHPEIKEEDIQITLEKGLLVIEIKGIGGTSKDSECWQISKIKNRRAKERNSFDVFGL
jgi:septin family protein